jgi:hypothetical protein
MKMVSHVEGGTHTEMFQNKVLKRILGPKRGEVAGECREL